MLSSDARALLQAMAHREGRAMPAASRRHLRVEEEPLVFVPLSLAGEDGALLAVGVGRTRRDFELLLCPEPRDHALSRQLLGQLAERINHWLDPLAADRELLQVSRSYRVRAARHAPQLVVPTPAAATLVRRLAERMVWQRSEDGDEGVVRAGGWLMLFCDRHELVPGDSLLLVATEAQLSHWVPPISAAEALHLLALNRSLAPGRGEHPVDAAWLAEKEPGSTLTLPSFDNEKLQPAIEAFNEARRRAPLRKSEVDSRQRAIERLLRPYAETLYKACHDALQRLRGLEPIPPLEGRRLVNERLSFTRHADFLADGARFARQDSLRRALYMIDDAERELRRVRREAVFYDSVVRAAAASVGEAFEGRLLTMDEEWVQGPSRRVRRRRLEVRIRGPWRPAGDGLFQPAWNGGPTCAFEVLALENLPEGDTRVVLRSAKEGIRAALKDFPRAFSVGEELAFVAYEREFPPLPTPEDVPWMFAGGARA